MRPQGQEAGTGVFLQSGRVGVSLEVDFRLGLLGSPCAMTRIEVGGGREGAFMI